MKNKEHQKNSHNQIFEAGSEIQFSPNLTEFHLYLKHETQVQIANNLSMNILSQKHDGDFYYIQVYYRL